MPYRRLRNGFQSVLYGRVHAADKRAPAAFFADRTRKLSCINAGNAGNAAFLHDLRERLGVAEIGGEIVVFAHDKSPDCGIFGFVVVV